MSFKLYVGGKNVGQLDKWSDPWLDYVELRIQNIQGLKDTINKEILPHPDWEFEMSVEKYQCPHCQASFENITLDGLYRIICPKCANVEQL